MPTIFLSTRPITTCMLMLVLGLSAGCGESPVVEEASSRLVPPSSASLSMMPAPPPATVRGIHDLLERWRASWETMDGMAYAANYAEDADFVNPLGGILSGRPAIGATHVFLFNGPFKGSSQNYQIRRLVALTGSLAIVDLNLELTGYAFLPPGLVATDGVVRTRGRLVVGRVGGEWLILAMQLTSLAP